MSRPFLTAAGASALALAVACNESGTAPAGLFSPTITNTGLAGSPEALAGEDELWLLPVRELDSAGRDLNQDGDAFDRIVHVQDLRAGTLRSTGLALETRGFGPIVAVADGLGLFAASEPAGGQRDLNGDGDAGDAVLVVVDGATGSVRNLGVAVSLFAPPAVGDGIAAVLVSESAQADRDLDGDGASASEVLHVYDSGSGELVNTGLPLASPLFIGGGQVALFRGESSFDLNGDGDRLDPAVLHVYDPATQILENSGLATLGFPPLPAAGTWLVSVPEDEQGLDLNQDADLEDLVLVVFDPSASLRAGDGAPAGASPWTTLGLASGGPSAAIASRASSSERFGLLVPEARDLDRNADGDLDDAVAFLYDPQTGVLTNTGLAAVRIVFVGDWLAILALEAGQGATDLNGDGDVLDAVAVLMNPRTGQLLELRQDALDLVGSEDDVLLLLRPESGSDADWNADGDRADVVVHAYDRITATSTNTNLAAAGVFGATRAEILLYVDERGENRDLDSDQDRLDAVFVLYDLTRRGSTSLALAGSGPSGFASLTRDGRIVLLANELALGRDLNGDRDRNDEIFHRAD